MNGSVADDSRARTAVVPRLGLTADEAARSLSVSRDFFDEHVLPELRVIRRGRRRIIPLREIERWLDREAAPTLPNSRWT